MDSIPSHSPLILAKRSQQTRHFQLIRLKSLVAMSILISTVRPFAQDMFRIQMIRLLARTAPLALQDPTQPLGGQHLFLLRVHSSSTQHRFCTREREEHPQKFAGAEHPILRTLFSFNHGRRLPRAMEHLQPPRRDKSLFRILSSFQHQLRTQTM